MVVVTVTDGRDGGTGDNVGGGTEGGADGGTGGDTVITPFTTVGWTLNTKAYQGRSMALTRLCTSATWLNSADTGSVVQPMGK